MQESFQPSLPTPKRRGMPMPNSMCVGDLNGKEYDLMEHVYFSDLTYSLTICMQAMAPTRSDITCRSHGIGEANKDSKSSHSLEVQREILYHDGCFPKAPNLGITFSHVKVTHAAKVWWEYHLPNSDLLNTRSALRWYLMWDCDPPP